MKNDRHRLPVDRPYVSSIGTALYCFARLEWTAIYCWNALEPGAIDEARSLSAGRIASRFIEAVARAATHRQHSALDAASEEFCDLVNLRNDIAHGLPGTGSGGAQLLFRDGRPLSIETIGDCADDFAACSFVLNRLYHKHLRPALTEI